MRRRTTLVLTPSRCAACSMLMRLPDVSGLGTGSFKRDRSDLTRSSFQGLPAPVFRCSRFNVRAFQHPSGTSPFAAQHR
jgi:hypothetical protein